MLTYKNLCDIISPLLNLGIAQMVARYLGVVEAVGSNPATQTKYVKKACRVKSYRLLRYFLALSSNIPSMPFASKILRVLP